MIAHYTVDEYNRWSVSTGDGKVFLMTEDGYHREQTKISIPADKVDILILTLQRARDHAGRKA